ncbi:LA2681 family HEPN domain-containing protein [Serratia rubidaea]|uniref:LA2681 family HEPN domain-containing protein n=1 Tax=Serratia rubidaea TaxID=61652 RepID=UPI003FA386B3
MTIDEINDLSEEADLNILNRDYEALESLIERLTSKDFEFEHPFYEAHYLYTIANCYSVLYENRRVKWYSDDLMKAIIYYRKSLHRIPKPNWNHIPENTQAFNNLKSMVLTNLANHLSSQGRILCCIPFYDEAIAINRKIEAIASKARNQIFLGESIYDNGHKEHHYFIAYRLTKEAMEHIEELHPEHRVDLEGDGYLIKFKEWFEKNFEESSFDYFSEEYNNSKTIKEKQYLQWCARNKLFINDLNDICDFEISHQDILSLPSFSQSINSTLTIHEELAYHGNFDEIKNDYCYARYLFFTAHSTSDEEQHFYNSTYRHVDDMSHSISNLKTSHYKTSFRILYSLFDKIAYLLSRFFDLNDIKDDNMISIDNLFRDFKSNNWRKKWEPNKKLGNNDNHFIHALFYILKDIRNVKDSSSVSKWIDPDAKAFSEIRNAMEHRSIKIVDDFGYNLTTSNNSYHDSELEKLNLEIKKIKEKLTFSLFPEESKTLESDLKKLESDLYEKKKLSSHSLLIPLSQFESRLMTLIKLARNSIIYLLLSIHLEEKNHPNDKICLPIGVPLKD